MSLVSLETQKLIDELVASGRFESAEQVIDVAVRFLDVEIQSEAHEPDASGPSPEEWCERFEAWARSHRALEHEADDSRESIYQGRGE